MEMNRIIREKRKQFGMTQQQVASALGVSASAVHKWETAAAYPDITLLPALARLLKTDLNELMGFEQEPSPLEITVIANEAAEQMQKNDYESGYRFAMEKVQEYPNSDKLISVLAPLLEGGLALWGRDSEKEKEYRQQIEQMYLRVAQSDDSAVRAQIFPSVFMRYLKRKEFEQAKELLEEIENNPLDKPYFQACLETEQGNYPKAKEILERKLYREAMVVQETMMSLMEIAIKEENEKQANRWAKLCSQISRMFELGFLSEFAAQFSLAEARKDREGLLSLLETMAETKKQVRKETSLYRDIPPKPGAEQAENELLLLFIDALEKEEELYFLHSEKRFQQSIQKLKEEIKGQK